MNAPLSKKVNTMSKSNKGNIAAVEQTNDKAVETVSFDKVFSAIPVKEHRTFNESDFAKVADLSFPATYAEVREFVKPYGANELFALCMKSGRTEVARVAKLYLDGVTDPHLHKSAMTGLKSAAGGKTDYFAGCLTYALLHFKKSS